MLCDINVGIGNIIENSKIVKKIICRSEYFKQEENILK